MDFVTHTLSGVSTARFLGKQKNEARCIGFAVMLAGALPDGDFWLGWIRLDLYGKYHRVATHSLIGLTLIILLSGTLAWWAGKQKWFRKLPLGFVPGAESPEDAKGASWIKCFLFSIWGANLHFWYDWITGWGSLLPFWPISKSGFTLGVVNSFDWVMLFLTLFFWSFLHLSLKSNDVKPLSIHKVKIGLALYILSVVGYISCRYLSGYNAVW